MNSVYTVGHSTHTAERFLSLIEQHGITALVDVRSSPYSRLNPHFGREALRAMLKLAGIHYVFLGAELGARSADPMCYESGRVRYDLLAQRSQFAQGLKRIEDGSSRFTIALLCAEGDPLTCHRTILVARHLVGHGVGVRHVHVDGSVETHEAAIQRLLREVGLEQDDMFRTYQDRVADAYLRREASIAYQARPRTAAEEAAEQEAHP